MTETYCPRCDEGAEYLDGVTHCVVCGTALEIYEKPDTGYRVVRDPMVKVAEGEQGFVVAKERK